MKSIFFIFLIIVINFELTGQTGGVSLPGQVTFISPQNIYVKFKSTDGISSGDTLFIKSDGKLIPALLVKNLSSTSCMCAPVSTTLFSVADPVIAKVVPPENDRGEETVKNRSDRLSEPNVEIDSTVKESIPAERKQIIKGSISLNSYSDISSTVMNNSQWYRYTFSGSAKNIANSNFSLESYVSFKYKAGDWAEVKQDIFSALKIFNLFVGYNTGNSTHISLGRKINPRISSIGAIDGLQFEKSINGLSVGALIGTRPDYRNYGFDSKLLQYGAYLAYNSETSGQYSETSLAFMQQMNNFKTDRRFLYFQHSNSIARNLYFFSTLEVDLYRLKIDTLNNEKAQNTFNLTGLYLSVNFKPFKAVSVSGSYDARKNVMYYESYKTFIDRVLENELRQGFRVQASYRITGDLTLGMQSGYRYLKSDPHPSRNLYSYVTYNRIPGANISATLSATVIESAYMSGKVYGLNFYRDFFKNKIQAGLGYRYVDYTLPENTLNILQNIGEISFSWLLFKKTAFSFNYEGTYEQQKRYDRIFLQLRKRF